MEKLYTLWQHMHYDNVDITVNVGVMEGTEEEVDEFARDMDCEITLHPNYLELVVNGRTSRYGNEDDDSYFFELCTKEITPISLEEIDKMSDAEKLSLFENPAYMITENDMQRMDWTPADAFQFLQEQRPNKTSFTFDSLSYSYKEYQS